MHADGTHAAHHDANKEIKHQERREGMQDVRREDTSDSSEDQSEKEHQWEKLSDGRWRTQFFVHQWLVETILVIHLPHLAEGVACRIVDDDLRN